MYACVRGFDSRLHTGRINRVRLGLSVTIAAVFVLYGTRITLWLVCHASLPRAYRSTLSSAVTIAFRCSVPSPITCSSSIALSAPALRTASPSTLMYSCRRTCICWPRLHMRPVRPGQCSRWGDVMPSISGTTISAAARYGVGGIGQPL